MTVLQKTSLYIIATMAVLNMVWMTYAGFDFVKKDLVVPVLFGTSLLAVSYFYTHYRPEKNLAAVTFWTAILIAFSVVAVTTSYLAASLPFSFKDSYLSAFDQKLGFDWLSCVEFVSAHPWMGKIMLPLYLSSMAFIAATLLYLGLTGRSERLEVFMTALFVTCFVTIFLSAPMVAIGPYGHYNVPLEVTQTFGPAVTTQGPGSNSYSHVMALRDGSMRLISLSHAEGLIIFPSFHTVMSVLMILAFIGCGWVFWAGLVVNVLILLTVPLEGNHYLADMMAGGVLAVLIWVAIERFQLFFGARTGREVQGILQPDAASI